MENPEAYLTIYMSCSVENIPADVIDKEQINLLQRAFTMFDSTKKGRIEKEKVRTILTTLGHTYDDSELEALLQSEDKEESGHLNFESFCRVASHFLENEDDEALQKELKAAFRLYDKEEHIFTITQKLSREASFQLKSLYKDLISAGNGYIPTSSLREILAALDDQLTTDQLNEMIAEIDTDSSGTVDFEGKCCRIQRGVPTHKNNLLT
ncbi:unnamed protein product [Brassicogethes aeneus]|uniref:EF-hand domain-containing protein n=1 Tax=Brassicogethes aeneus TaxID=1431903 RepID=A0A9P0BHR0_BRAAE|nr:unnamed protein product [Brassicogethes aeneus]